ncbi:cysteine dioxygenase family protein [Terrabacter sp. NPDC080008]|uniref:cysteine dioxygenase n=1 Tax=Terrabacter sp. NPDC080008 TaxID=3155176 RepID=UPI00344BD0C3
MPLRTRTSPIRPDGLTGPPAHAQGPRQPGTAVDLAATARHLAGERTLWAGLVDFDPISRYYARVAAESDHEAWLLTWLPGQGTEWHDHGQSAGSFIVLHGQLTERVATPSGLDGAPQVEKGARRLRTGQQRTFGPSYVHHVSNVGPDLAISLHVYAPRLTVMTTYAVSSGNLHPVEVQQKGVDW